METYTYKIDGMSCEHCVKSITEEVEKISGATDVKVDLASETLTLKADHDPAQEVDEAVDEAGAYSVVS
ncbi:MAG: heavy metal-associated domain-containing protein [Micrococcaceae bacterium]